MVLILVNANTERLCWVATHQQPAGLFDSHSLFTDIFARPQLYLNGTAPLNVTGAVHACVLEPDESPTDPGVCTDAVGTDQDSFLW